MSTEEGGGVRAREDEHIATSGQGQREAGWDGGVHRRVLPPNLVARPQFGMARQPRRRTGGTWNADIRGTATR